MSTALRKPMSLEDFLAWEERQTLRYEFDGWQPVAMTGGTVTHELIGGTLRALLREQLHGKPCRAVGPTLKIEVTGRIRYPDAFVYCSPVVPGATVIRAETDSSGDYPYEVHLKKSDGTYVTVELDSTFTVVKTVTGFGPPPAGTKAPSGTPPTGSGSGGKPPTGAPPAVAPSSSASAEAA